MSETNAAGATDTYGYDASSNLACVSYPNTVGQHLLVFRHPERSRALHLQPGNQLTSLTDWAGDTLTFTYSGNGQQCWVSTYAPSTPSCSSAAPQSGSVTTNYTYDSLGNVSDVQTTTGTVPDEPARSRSWEPQRREFDITAETPDRRHDGRFARTLQLQR